MFTWKAGFKSDMKQAQQKAQEFVDSEVLRYCADLVPFLSGTLQKSGTLNTKIGSGTVTYKTPYARKQYYQGASKGQRGRLWFERMKASHKETIRAGAGKVVERELHG